MANRFIEGFDYLVTADLPKRFGIVVASTAISAGNGRNGTASLRATNTQQGVSVTFDLQATWIVGMSFKISALPSNDEAIVGFDDASGARHVTFGITPTGALVAKRGSISGTTLGTGSTPLVAGTTYYLEFKVTISDTVGVAITKINGSTDINLSSQDTKNAGTSASASMVTLLTGSNEAKTVDIDDLYINDGSGGVDDDFWGDGRVIAKTVDGAGNSAQFTPSAGSNWQNVDDAAPNGDTDYNESSTVNHIDSMTTAAIGVTGTVKGVGVSVYARKTDAGVGTLAPLWRISGTDYAGTGVPLSTDYLYVTQLYRVSPATAAAWTVSELDGAELGYKRTA